MKFILFYQKRKFALYLPALFFLLVCSAVIAQEKTEEPQHQKAAKSEFDVKKEIEENHKELQNIKENKEPEKKLNFFYVGGGIGSPSGANLIIGAYFNRLMLRATGMHYNSNWHGAQGDLGFAFYRKENLIQSIAITGGSYVVNPNISPNRDAMTWQERYIQDSFISSYPLTYQYFTRARQTSYHQNYIGLSYDLYMSGFIFQLGAGSGSGDYPNAQLIVQVGYVFDFGRF